MSDTLTGGQKMADRMRKMMTKKTPAERMTVPISERSRLSANKLAHKLLILAASKTINLKNSPPYLPSLLVDTDELLTQIFDVNTWELLKNNFHLRIFLNGFREQCKKTLALFKDAKDQMEDPDGPYRRELSKFTLVFNHMLAELKAMWPGGVFNSRVTIVKHEARDFWESNWPDTAIVSWDTFTTAFGRVHKFHSPEEIVALRKTVDLLENHHVSRFEFDVFTRLFQPWKQIMNTWNIIVVTHPGYQAFLTYDEVEARLQKYIRKPGSYVFRLSCTRLGQWAIGFVTAQQTIVQTIPQSKSLYQALIDGIEEKVYIYPDGQDHNPDIQKAIRVPPEDHIKVTREQFDLYEQMDTTFELCKICATHPKSVRIEPCGHLLCRRCLDNWTQESHGRDTQCPFCRESVLSTEAIVVDPYKNKAPPRGQRLDREKAAARASIFSVSEDDDDDDDSDDDVAADYENINLSSFLARGASSPAPARPPRTGAPALPPRGNTVKRGGFAPAQLRQTSSNVSGGREPHPSVDDATARLCALGFSEPNVRKALKVAKGDIKMAADILLQFGD